MVRLPCARRPEVFGEVHLHPVEALALCVRVNTKLILEAKFYRVIGRGLEHHKSVILFALAISLFLLYNIHENNATYTFHYSFW